MKNVFFKVAALIGAQKIARKLAERAERTIGGNSLAMAATLAKEHIVSETYRAWVNRVAANEP